MNRKKSISAPFLIIPCGDSRPDSRDCPSKELMYASITPSILQLARDGKTSNEIAAYHGITSDWIRLICRRGYVKLTPAKATKKKSVIERAPEIPKRRINLHPLVALGRDCAAHRHAELIVEGSLEFFRGIRYLDGKPATPVNIFRKANRMLKDAGQTQIGPTETHC